MRTIPFGKPIIEEEEKRIVAEVLDSPQLVHGPRAKEFEASFASFTSAPHAVSVSSCTAALHLSYFNRGIGPGDEVIVPAQTHVATAHAVELCGATPVFVDAEKLTGNIDIEQIEAAITERTRALSVVHYLGMPVDMERITAIAAKHDLFVVEDCALAIGTFFRGIHAGLHGDTGSFSFYPVKHMTTAEGGMLITRDETIAIGITHQRAFGVDRYVGERKIPGQYDVTQLGFNYRLNEIQAALGIEQLKKMPSFLKKRKANYDMLSRGLSEIDEIGQFDSTRGDFQSSYYCLSILLNAKHAQNRSAIIEYLKSNGVGTSIYYPRPVPHFTFYQQRYGFVAHSFPVAAWISMHSIALPVGPHLDQEDMTYIVETVKNALAEVR